MSWARFDDRYDDNRKIKRAWKRNPRAIGLHAMAITYSARHHTDGEIDAEWLEEKIPRKRDRDQCVAILVEAGLLERTSDHVFRVHDFLDYNESRHDRAIARREERQRKQAAGRKGGLTKAENARKTAETASRSASSDLAGASRLPGEAPSSPSSASVARTAPHRTAPTNPPSPPGGNDVIESKELDDAKERLRDEEFTGWLADHASVTGHTPPREGTKARAAITSAFGARRQEGYSVEDLKLATRGARANDYRRENGYDTAESVLRPTKIHDLIERGRRAGGGPRPSFEELAAAADRREREAEARQKAGIS